MHTNRDVPWRREGGSALVIDDVDPQSARAVVVSAAPTLPPTTMEMPAFRPPSTRRWQLAALGTVLAIGAIFIAARSNASHTLPTQELLAQAAAAAKAKGVGVGELLMLGPCPDDMALVDNDGVRACVDKYEGSIVETMPDGHEVPWSPYTPVAKDRKIRAVSQPNVVPQGYISRNEAERACGASGKRLCSSEEWLTACEGPKGTSYPYGASEDPKACNTHGANPLKHLFGGARWAYSMIPMNHPLLNTVPGSLAKTGEFDKCTNEYGVYDMVGNLHEWTADSTGVFRGGYYLDTKINGKGCGYATTAHAPSYHDYSTGFRCCKDAD